MAALRGKERLPSVGRMRGEKTGSNAGRMSIDEMNSTLVKAVKEEEESLMTCLLTAGADVNTKDELGRPLLYIVLENSGNPDLSKLLLDKGALPDLTTSSSTHQTALHLAAKKGFQVCVGQLLSVGCNPDPVDAIGNTPFMYASRNGHDSTVRTLLKAGVDQNRQNANKETAFHLAVKHGSLSSVRQLLSINCSTTTSDTQGMTPLLTAAQNNQIEILECLLNHACNINEQDMSTGKTALHWSVEHGNRSAVTKLIQMNANMDLRDVDWKTAFMIATSHQDEEIMKQLIEAGCDVGATDKFFNTCLHLSSSEGQAELIPLFIKSGLNVNLKGAAGMTPLMLGAFCGHERVVSTLLRLGANPNILDRNRANAIVYALMSNAFEEQVNNIVKCLIQFNCNLDDGANLSRWSQLHSLPQDISNVQLEDKLYSVIEMAFLRDNITACLMFIRAGCDLSQVNLLTKQSKNKQNKQQQTKLLMNILRKHKNTIPSLKHLCRKPALEMLLLSVSLEDIERLTLPDTVKQFLQFSDLKDILKSSISNDIKVTSPSQTKLTMSCEIDQKLKTTIDGNENNRSTNAKTHRLSSCSDETSPKKHTISTTSNVISPKSPRTFHASKFTIQKNHGILSSSKVTSGKSYVSEVTLARSLNRRRNVSSGCDIVRSHNDVSGSDHTRAKNNRLQSRELQSDSVKIFRSSSVSVMRNVKNLSRPKISSDFGHVTSLLDLSHSGITCKKNLNRPRTSSDYVTSLREVFSGSKKTLLVSHSKDNNDKDRPNKNHSIENNDRSYKDLHVKTSVKFSEKISRPVLRKQKVNDCSSTDEWNNISPITIPRVIIGHSKSDLKSLSRIPVAVNRSTSRSTTQSVAKSSTE